MTCNLPNAFRLMRRGEASPTEKVLLFSVPGSRQKQLHLPGFTDICPHPRPLSSDADRLLPPVASSALLYIVYNIMSIAFFIITKFYFSPRIPQTSFRLCRMRIPCKRDLSLDSLLNSRKNSLHIYMINAIMNISFYSNLCDRREHTNERNHPQDPTVSEPVSKSEE